MKKVQAAEQTIDSREVAEMVEKSHSKLLRDIGRYEKQFTEAKIGFSDFFTKSSYKDSTGRLLPCYRITKKGCEFIAHKLTGIKGTIFTARYINRFHEMEDIITNQKREVELPWFVRKFRGKYIVLERDFISITGVNIKEHRLFYRMEYFKGGVDYNGWAWYTTVNKEEFKKEYGFGHGDDKCMLYFYPCGVIKALRILANDKKVPMNLDIAEMLEKSMKMIMYTNQKMYIQAELPCKKSVATQNNLTVQISIACKEN